MRQFDVLRSPLRRGKNERPFFVVVQCDYIDSRSRLCAALIDERFLQPLGRLNPAFTIAGQRCYLHPVEMVTLPLRVLRDPVANLEAERERIVAALDMVFTGI